MIPCVLRRPCNRWFTDKRHPFSGMALLDRVADMEHMEQMVTLMMSWAVTLTPYPMPEKMPIVERVPHSFLVFNACRNKECKVQGWFPPGNTIYLDSRLDPANSVYASSVLLHELIHYLQQESKTSRIHASCNDNVAAEREAYGAQKEYLLRYGIYHPVGAAMHGVSC